MAKEYIERATALDALYDNEYTTLCPLDEVSSVIGAIPAADVVEVVRCKDCKSGKHLGEIVRCSHPYGLTVCCGNDFCSNGERRKDNAAD